MKKSRDCYTPLGVWRKCLMIMKLTFVFMLLGLMTVSAGVYSQSAKLNLRITNGTLEEVFREIERQSDYSFLFKDESLDKTKVVTINKRNATVQEVLEHLLKGADVQFDMVDQYIVVHKKEVERSITTQQQKEVSGTVTDEVGEPLPGVSVVVKGTTIGITTDLDGKYTLRLPANAETLVFSFIGMQTQEVLLEGQAVINVALREETKGLEEVVVVGYGIQKKSNMTGAVQSISSAELENRAQTSATRSLQGAIPNLNIYYSSGKSNATPTFNIRGTTTLSGNGSPLIVIDGVASTVSELSRINPNDIESVSSLMDAASAAIYGARAAFGVVLVTTKNGKKEGVYTSISSNASFKKPIIIPEYIMEPNIVLKARVAGSGGWYNLKSIWGVNDWDLLDQITAGEAEEIMLNPEDPSKWLTAARTNWYKEAMRDYGFTQNHSMSVSGKNKKTSYFLSGSYSREEGIVRYGNDVFDKYNMRVKVGYQLTDWLNVANNSSYTYDVMDEPSQGYNFASLENAATTSVIKNPDGSWSSNGASYFGKAIEGGEAVTRNNRFWTSFTAKADILEDVLWVTGKATFMRSSQAYKAYWLPVKYKVGPEDVKTHHPVKDAQRTASTSRQNVFDVFADFDKKFGESHVHVLVGYNQEYRYSDWFKAYRKDLISSSVPSINNATGDKELDESITDWATRSGFFRVNYDYAGKYLFEVNGRYDGTSRFPKDDRWVFVPSASLGWNMYRENFFEPLRNVLTSFKPRVSYGILGNQNVGAYSYIAEMGDGKTSSILDGGEYDQQLIIKAPGLVSASLSWERVETKNIGFDFGLFKNKLIGNFDYYHRATKDMLTKGKELPGVLGTGEPKENAADLITKGWEIALSWKDDIKIGGDKLNYNARLTLSDSRAWITKFDNPEGRLNDYYEGYEIGTIWGYEVNGLFQSEEEIKNHANQSAFWSYPGKTIPGPGDIKFEDLNGDGEIRGGQTVNDLKDLKKIGNSRSRYHIGFRLGGDFKGFDFSAFFQGVLKRDWYPTGYQFWGLNAGPWTNLRKWNYENSWTPEHTDAYLPRLKGYAATSWSGGEMIKTNTRYLQNAAYVRLKSVNVGYTIPRILTDKLNIAKVRVSVGGENLSTWTGIKSPNIDPETLGGNYPMQRIYTVGVNVQF
ncbi:SusC/RagA family TonB-linked outer membrane protein [Puteibacter caeruleilacunae]|nr:SusC/RagA family TonB-linked outer membrane protein [Puteibacter caeruleilacunae]